MTREEAIDIIKSECYVFNPLNFDRSTMVNTALDMAVNALKQEPCEDVISRQAVIDALWKALYEYEDKTEKQFLESEELDVYDWFQHRIFVQNMSDIDRQTILNLPSVTPQPKIGRWVFKHNSSDIWCSCCNASYDETPQTFYYCPNCGAKMPEVEE